MWAASIDRAAERPASKVADRGGSTPRSVLHGATSSYAVGYQLQRTGAEGAPPAPRKSRSPEGPRPLPRRYAVDSSQQSTSMSSYSVHRSIPPTQGTVPTISFYPDIPTLNQNVGAPIRSPGPSLFTQSPRRRVFSKLASSSRRQFLVNK